jgi:hypothetical protein
MSCRADERTQAKLSTWQLAFFKALTNPLHGLLLRTRSGSLQPSLALLVRRNLVSDLPARKRIDGLGGIVPDESSSRIICVSIARLQHSGR